MLIITLDLLCPLQSLAGGPSCNNTDREASMTFAESSFLLQKAKDLGHMAFSALVSPSVMGK